MSVCVSVYVCVGGVRSCKFKGMLSNNIHPLSTYHGSSLLEMETLETGQLGLYFITVG